MAKIVWLLWLLFLLSCTESKEKETLPSSHILFSNQLSYESLCNSFINKTQGSNIVVVFCGEQRDSLNAVVSNILSGCTYKLLAYYEMQESEKSIQLSDSADMIVILDKPNKSIVSKLNLITENRVDKPLFVMGGQSAAELFFRKIANVKNSPAQVSNQSRVGVGEVEVTTGYDLVNLPIVLTQTSSEGRMSEMLSVAMQNPADYVISIDDSTSLLVHNNVIKVCGKGQMFMIKHLQATTRVDNGLFGAENLQTSIYLPGDSVVIK